MLNNRPLAAATVVSAGAHRHTSMESAANGEDFTTPSDPIAIVQ
jgi:hypothetical protein